jgi:hypothetical protein
MASFFRDLLQSYSFSDRMQIKIHHKIKDYEILVHNGSLEGRLNQPNAEGAENLLPLPLPLFFVPLRLCAFAPCSLSKQKPADSLIN